MKDFFKKLCFTPIHPTAKQHERGMELQEKESINQNKYISLPNKKYSNSLLQCCNESLSTYL